jgi:hypothetical protein
MTDLELLNDDGVLLCNLAALCCAVNVKEIADHAVFFFIAILVNLIALLHFARGQSSLATQLNLRYYD